MAQRQVILLPNRLEPGQTLSLTHPVAFLRSITPYRRLAGASRADEIQDWRNLAQAYASGAKEIPPLRTARGAARCGGETATAAHLEATGAFNREADGPLLKRRLSSASSRPSGARWRSFDERRTLVTAGEASPDCMDEVPAWRQQLEDAREIMAALEARCSLLEEWLKDGATRRTMLERRIDSLERQNEKLLDRAVSSDVKNADLAETLNERELLVAALRRDLERAKAREDELTAEAAAAREFKERVELLHKSTSWRITAPLRAAMRTLLWLQSQTVRVLRGRDAVSPLSTGESTGQILPEAAGSPGTGPLVDDSMQASISGDRCNRILIVENRLPMPDRCSSSVRMWEMMKTICALGEAVTFASHCGPEFYYCILGDTERELSKYVQVVEGLGVPIVYNYDCIVDHLERHGREYKMVILCLPEIMHDYYPAIRRCAPQAHVVYDTVDLHGLRFEREAQVRGGKELEERACHYRKMENANLRLADTVVAITEKEREAILEAGT